jgi:hypothetical protein
MARHHMRPGIAEPPGIKAAMSRPALLHRAGDRTRTIAPRSPN